MRATVDNVEARDREESFSLSSQLHAVQVERDVLERSSGSAGGHGDTKDSVGTQGGLVGGAVDLAHGFIEFSLLRHVHADELNSEDIVDVLHGLEHTLAEETSLVTVTEFAGFIDTSGSARGNGGTEETLLGGQVNLDGGVATRVEDFTCVERLDGAHARKKSSIRGRKGKYTLIRQKEKKKEKRF
jgi:hypothetical protein